MKSPEISLEQFRERISTLPVQTQIELINQLFDTIYGGLDDKVFRVMATAIRHAKDSEIEGHEKFQIPDTELEKLSHIQDKNRLIQQKK